MEFLIALIVLVVVGGIAISAIAMFAAVATSDPSGKKHARWFSEHGEAALGGVFTGEHNVTFMEQPGMAKRLSLKDLLDGANRRGYELVSSTPSGASSTTHVFKKVGAQAINP